jgi:RNA polymerase subunit RPABC4/transcription elongation factor Spt4
MFDQVFGDLSNTINEFLASPAFQLALRAIGVYIVLIWLASAFWAYRDMRQRSANPVAPYLAAALVIVFTPILFLFGLLLYRILRPKETLAEANDRALAEEAILAEVAARPHCANCTRPVNEDWIICPTCRNRLRRVCPNCERLVELDWSICAWCGKDFERAEPIGSVYMPPTRGNARPLSAPRPAAARPVAVPARAAPPAQVSASRPAGGPTSPAAPAPAAPATPATTPAAQSLAGEH